MAIDYGERKMGVAISDELEITSATLPVITASTVSKLVPKLLSVIKAQKPDLLLIGLPTNWEGKEIEMTRKIKTFAAKLTELNYRIEFWDEAYTTKQAEAGKRGKLKKFSDSEAARIMLEEYLGSRQNKFDQNS
jgi:putative Holliday junction resolvase